MTEWLILALPAGIAAVAAGIILRDLWRGQDSDGEQR
jgi:hypothetical protein